MSLKWEERGNTNNLKDISYGKWEIFIILENLII
jgi:hypothetical protein